MSNLATLLPPKSTPLERAISQVTTRTSDINAPIRNLWDPDTCPAELLPWLAWSLSLDSWKPYWPESVKRQRIREAIKIQQRKGTTKSVRDVVQSFGSSIALKDWWQNEPKTTPYTFDVVLSLAAGVPNTAQFQQDIIDEVARTKPARSQFTFTAGLSASGGLGLQGAVRVVRYQRLDFQEV